MKFARQDYLWAAAFATVGLLLGLLALIANGRLYFYQFFMPEMAYLACGGQFAHPATIPPALFEFLAYRVDSFDCSTLDLSQPMGPAGLFARGHLYLALTVSGLWRLFSVNYLALLPLIGLLYAAYAAGSFVLVRLFFPRGSAIAGGVLLTLSASALSMSVYLRDFAKAPFFIWALIMLILAMRATRWRAELGWAAAAGVTVGLGYGFRSDIVVLVPVGILLLMIGPSVRGWLTRLAGSAVFAALVLVAGAPVFSGGGGAAGGLGAMMLEGGSDPFNTYLDLGAVPYSWGARYSDELTLSAIAADMGQGNADWSDGEGQAIYGFTQSLGRSTEYMLSRIDLFIGDLATRALKSAAWILAYPSVAEQGRNGLDPGGIAVSTGLASVLAPVYSLLGRVWIIPLGLLGAAAFMLREVTSRPREAIALLGGFGILLGYTALQFSMRHAFHLEFMWILGLLALLHLTLNPRAVQSGLKPFLIGSVVVVTAIGMLYGGLLVYQSGAMRSEIDKLLQAPRETVDVVQTVADGAAVFAIPVPPEHRAIVAGAPDSMVGGDLPVAVTWKAIAAADRLLITLGGPGCDQPSVPLSIGYDKRNAWQALDEVIMAPAGSATSNTYVVFPAFYRATQNLASITVPADIAACIQSVQRIDADSRLPASLVLVLAPDWQSHPLALSLF